MAVGRVLVTGATGFIGQAVTRRLLADGHEVLALHGARAPAFTHPNLEWASVDLLGATAGELTGRLRGERLSHCLHTAWYTHHADYLVADLNEDWREASVRLARAFRQAGGTRFVGLGTCVEYDAAANGEAALAEDAPLRPETPYAEAKLEVLRAIEADGGDFAWARVFFVYGPGDRGGRLIPFVLSKYAAGEAAGPRFGRLRRDYIHVDDLAGQLARIAAADVQGAVNTGTGAAVGIGEVFQTAADLFGRLDLVEANEALAPDQPTLIEADMRRFEAEVGPREARDLRTGLAPLVEAARR